MRSLLACLLILPIFLKAQETPEVKFEKDLTWQQILDKAKNEHKYILLDCYATWCGPCTQMDQRIYPLAKVGSYINSRFISVKIQLDSTSKDDDQTRKMYGDAHKLLEKYNIQVLPTYLFFSPEGQIVHRGVGYMDESDFIMLAMNATDSSKQVYSLLENYRQGKRDYATMPYLFWSLNSFDKQLGSEIGNDYIGNYLVKLNKDELFHKKNIDFIGQNTQRSKDPGFDFGLRYSREMDSVMWRDYTETIISSVIKKEEIDPYLWQNNKPVTDKPHWNRINAFIAKKYNKYYAGRTVLDAKLQWYSYTKQWPDFCRALIQRVDHYGPFGIGDIYYQYNDAAWDIFQHSYNKKQLSRALFWSDSSLKQTPPNVQCLDTYANLLYKLGRKNEAIVWEQKALDMENQMAYKKGKSKGYFSDEFSSTLVKIRNGEPTW